MNSDQKTTWSVVLANPAKKSLERVPARDQARIVAAIEKMKEDPLNGDVRKLHGGLEGFRRRVGNWRLFFDVYVGESLVVITAIKRRTSTTH